MIVVNDYISDIKSKLGLNVLYRMEIDGDTKTLKREMRNDSFII